MDTPANDLILERLGPWQGIFVGAGACILNSVGHPELMLLWQEGGEVYATCVTCLGGVAVSVTGGCYSETVMTAPSIAVSVTAITWYHEMTSVVCLGDKEAFVTRMDFPFQVTQLEEILRLNSVNLPHVDCSVLSGILRTDRTFKSLIPITWYLLYSINQEQLLLFRGSFFFLFLCCLNME